MWSGRHVSVTEKRTFWLTVLRSYSTWHVAAGREAEQAFRRMKETHGLPNRGQKQRKRRVESRLKVTDPW